ncbi:MAG: hypothetical protein M1541_20855 [Acidobacteria bacterium]|nr:hypothetical protein [Acidobacteriota bacterium]
MPAVPYDHPCDEALEQYSIGALSASETGPFEEHLLVCTVCQDRLREVDVFVRTMRQAARNLQGGREGAGSRWTRLRLLAAPAPACALALAGIAVLLPLTLRTWRAGTPAAGPATMLTLRAVRGNDALGEPVAPAGKPLALLLDVIELPASASYRVELVNSHGAPLLASQVRVENGRAILAVPKLAAGRYWIRVYEPAPQKELLREFGLQVD